jgi:hypothetical protein
MADAVSPVAGLPFCMIKPLADIHNALYEGPSRDHDGRKISDLRPTQLLLSLLSFAAELTPILLVANRPDHARPLSLFV